jgi:hypothetical protein
VTAQQLVSQLDPASLRMVHSLFGQDLERLDSLEVRGREQAVWTCGAAGVLHWSRLCMHAGVGESVLQLWCYGRCLHWWAWLRSRECC